MNKKTGKNLVILVIVIFLIICGGFYLVKKDEISAKKTMEKYLEELKNGKFSSKGLGQDLENNVEQKELDENPFIKKYYSNLKYKTLKTKKDSKDVIIEMEISNKDFSVVLTEYMKISLELSMNNLSQNLSRKELDKKINKHFEEKFNIDNVNVKTNVVKIKMEKRDNNWIVKEESKNDLVNALMPGMKEITENIK